MSGNPFDWAPAQVEFKKLDDLPKHFSGLHTQSDVLKAMKALHHMIHAQAKEYGGKNTKLLPAGITEQKPTFKTFLALCEQATADDEHRKELYQRWKKLINMSPGSIENFKKSQTEKGRKDPKKYPGLKPKAAAKIGISSGVQSAGWIIKMKNTPVKEWTPEMWKWAGKQVSFVSRMLGNSGPMYDENGEPTRKLLSLKIWGHNPR